MLAAAEPSILSLLPAVVAIVLAFTTRQVLLALFAGILCGSLVVLIDQPGTDANPLERFFFPAIGSKGFARILLVYLWCLGGLIGIWSKTGAATWFAERVGARVVRGPRSARFFAWLLGMVFHQGGTVSTVLAGTTAKPMCDKHRVSHEELSYIVDSTASPVATVLPFNAWPAYIAPLVAGSIPVLTRSDPDVQLQDAVWFYFRALPYNFYGIFAVISTLLFSLCLLPWIGKTMALARTRALATGRLDREGAEPMVVTDADAAAKERHSGYRPALIDFAAPILVLIGVAVIPRLLQSFGWVRNGDWISEAFALSVLTAVLICWRRGMPLAAVIDGFVKGCGAVTIGALILALAVTIGEVSKQLHTADWVVARLHDNTPAILLPAALTFVSMAIGFATGTSWGTYAVVFPLAMPLAWAMRPDEHYALVCFGAVVGGAVFGDQCSPISDTTILSSMFSGCDLLDHVRTQLPLALAVAACAAIASTLCVL
ncbi:MAG: Na+/H+ antiporter NhaC family protein [Planctomycetota bacterium]